MKLIDYLRTRHKTVNALTRPEAKVLGIHYPLQAGWVKAFGQVEIPEEIVEKLVEARKARYQKESYKKNKVKAAKRKGKIAEKVAVAKVKKADREIANLVRNIVGQGCTDKDRMINHLMKPHK